MRLFAFLATLSLMLLQPGCAGIYDGLRNRQEMECRTRPGADPDDCSQRPGMSYDEYQKQLKDRELNKEKRAVLPDAP